MSYQAELQRLQSIIVADESNDEQRDAAQAALDALIDNRIDDLFGQFESRTAEFSALIARLRSVIDRISANRLTGAIESVNEIVNDVRAAASAGETE
jgi:hypothetical protein